VFFHLFIRHGPSVISISEQQMYNRSYPIVVVSAQGGFIFNAVLTKTAEQTSSALRRVVLRKDVTFAIDTVKLHITNKFRFKLYIL